MFSEDKLFNNWNSKNNKFNLINYILPADDLEDFNLIKKNIKNLESYDFKEIIDKYGSQLNKLEMLVLKYSEIVKTEYIILSVLLKL